jgi:hypothetical protein
MIWFSCQQCGKVQGRPEESAGVVVFCACGKGNVVPWESTAAEPEEAPEPVVPASPRLEPMSFDPPAPRGPLSRPASRPPAVEPPPVPRPRRRRERYQSDPNFCFNHQSVASQKTCADCGEAFCAACVVTFRGLVLCGPCKNFRVHGLEQPPRVSGLALASLILAFVTGPLALILLATGNLMVSLLPLVLHATALALGVLALRATEKDSRLSGRSLAITGILAAAVAALLTVALTMYGPGS